jgi:hypothetical protein
MRTFCASGVLWTTLTLLALYLTTPSLAGATAIAEKTLPKQQSPTTEYKDVIPPPKTGDEGIYTEAPDPNAGHKEEVLPPPDTSGGEHPNVEHPL